MDRYSTPKCVILFVIDALRKDHLFSYGYKRNTAPNLEKYVKEGITFMNAITNGPESPSSFSTIFSSNLPFLNGGYSPIPNQKILFPEILRKNGFFCYGIHNNPHLSKGFNYERSFDIYLDCMEYFNIEKPKNEEQKKKGILVNILNKLRFILNYKNYIKILFNRLRSYFIIRDWIIFKFPRIIDIISGFFPIQYIASYITKKIINFLKDIDRNFFLFVHYNDVHNPFEPPERNLKRFRKNRIPKFRIKFLNDHVYKFPKKYNIDVKLLNEFIDLYDGGINYLDQYLSKIFKIIDKRFKNNCLIIITADHGESFYEHGFLNHQGHIYDELLKIPLFMIEKGKEISYKKVNEMVELIDIAPTILDFLKIEVPDFFQGQSLLPLLNDQRIEGKKYIISETYQKNGKIKRNELEGYILLSIKSPEWKYIYDQQNNQEYLFNIKDDPNERSNLIMKNPLISQKLRVIKDNHLKEITHSKEKSLITYTIKKLNLKKIKLNHLNSK